MKKGPRPGARYSKYALFTPTGLAEAVDMARKLPIPTDPKILKDIGYPIRNGWCRAVIDIPQGVAWLAYKLWNARGISRTRLYGEILTYYLVAQPEGAFDGVPAALADFRTPEAEEMLTRVMTRAVARAQKNVTGWGGTIGEWAELADVAVKTNDFVIPNSALTREKAFRRNHPLPKPVEPPTPEEQIEHEEFDVRALK